MISFLGLFRTHNENNLLVLGHHGSDSNRSRSLPSSCSLANAVSRRITGRKLQHSRKKPTQEAINIQSNSQYVNTTGPHAFAPPILAAGDVRGPCPNLNTAANHGYIPHKGVGTIGDFINGTNTAYGMSLDLGGILGD